MSQPLSWEGVSGPGYIYSVTFQTPFIPKFYVPNFAPQTLNPKP